jgi:hypothetical protein
MFWMKKEPVFEDGSYHNDDLKGVVPDSSFIIRDTSFIAPQSIDHRDFCIPTNDQFNNPYCTGYATAGYIEIKHWQQKFYPLQYDAVKIYEETKKIDGIPNKKGSYIQYAVLASKNLGYIDGTIKFINKGILDIKFAIFKYGAFIGSFSITNDWYGYNVKKGVIKESKNSHYTGGHAVLVCGYDKKGIYIQNSWGYDWGVWGFGLLPWNLVEEQFRRGLVIDDIVIKK